MKDSDIIQVWEYCIDSKAGHDWGAIKLTTVEVVDFGRMVVDAHTKGVHEGDRVNERSSYIIGDTATPERCAAYRRRNGYKRLK